MNEDEYEISLPVTPFMFNRAGIVHGGITGSFDKVLFDQIEVVSIQDSLIIS